MDVASLYASKLTTPEMAVADIPSGSKLSMAMAMSEPPAQASMCCVKSPWR